MTKHAHIGGTVLCLAGSVDCGAGELFGTTEAHMPEYHLSIGNRGLILAKGGWSRSMQQRQAAQFATNGPNTASRIKDAATVITGWQGGEDTKRHSYTNPSRYYEGAGINIYEESGTLSLGPYMAAPAALQTAINGITALGVHEQYMVLGMSNGTVYRWDGTTLSLAGDTTKSTGGIKSFGVFQGGLYIGNGEDGKVWRWQGTTLLTSFAENFTVGGHSGATVSGVHTFLSVYLEGRLTMYFGSSSSNGVGYATEIANTAGTTSSATAGSLVPDMPKIAVLLQLDDNLIAVCTNETSRKWELFTSNDTDPPEWSRRASRRDSYITCGAVFNDAAYFGDAIKGRIWRWDGSELTIYRQLGSDLSPYATAITGMTVWRDGLWISILHSDGTCSLLRDNGSTDWSRPVYGLSGTTPGPLLVFNDQMHYATQATGAAKVFRTDGTFTSTGYVVSGLIDGQLPGEDKLWSSVTLSHGALAASQSVEVQYRLGASGSWVSLGTSDVDGAEDVTLTFPAGTMSKLLALKLILTGVAGSSTALQVYDVALAYNPSKGAKREWDVSVELFGHTGYSHKRADGSAEPFTGEELSAEIWALIDTETPVLLYDIDRDEPATVLITGYSEKLGQASGGPMPNINALSAGWDFSANLKLQEV